MSLVKIYTATGWVTIDASHAISASYSTHADSATISTTAGSAAESTNATHADSATVSTNAGHADSATISTTAGSATESTHADSATISTTAGSATISTTAGSAAESTYAYSADSTDGFHFALDSGTITWSWATATATFTVLGKTTRKIILRAQSFVPPTTNGAALTKIDGTYFSYYVLDFDKDTDEYADIDFDWPDDYDGGNITVKFHWIANATSGDVVWNFVLSARGDSANYGDVALGSPETKTDTTDGTANDLNITTFTAYDPGASIAGGAPIAIRVSRDANNGADTLAVDARLVKVVIDYTGR